MILACPSCNMRYAVPNTAIPAAGRTVRCASCQHSWFQPPADPNADEDVLVAAVPMPDAPAPVADVAEQMSEAEQVEAGIGPPSMPAPAPDAEPQPQPVEPVAPVDMTASAPQPQDAALAEPASIAAQPVAGEALSADPFTSPSVMPLVDEPFPESHLAADEPLPFRRGGTGGGRRWAVMAGLAALLIIAAAASFKVWGLPNWAQGLGVMGTSEETDLVIELPPNQDHRELPDGSILFAVSGVIINPTDREQRVPPIFAKLLDAQGTVVYSWTIKPPVATLAPNAKVNFSEAKLDIPRRATELSVDWDLPSR